MTGIQALDTAVQTTEEWIGALMARLGWRDKERAYLALLAALHALRDALPRDEGWHPASHIPQGENPQRLLGANPRRVASRSGIDAEQVAHAVFRFLPNRLPVGEIDDAKAATPQALRMFWPA